MLLKKEKVQPQTMHLDSYSFLLQGNYCTYNKETKVLHSFIVM